MKLEFETKVLEEGNDKYIELPRPEYFPGSMMSPKIEVNGEVFATKIVDVSSILIVFIPSEFECKVDETIKGKLLVKKFIQNLKAPRDLQEALSFAGLTFDCLSPLERRQALLFLREASTAAIRSARIETILNSCRKQQNTPYQQQKR